MLIGSHLTPTPGINRGKYRYLDGPCTPALESIRREDAGRALVTGVAAAVDDEQTH